MTIIPEFADPNYLYIGLDTKVKYDPKNSRYTENEIGILVRGKINEYFSTELQKFDKDFVYSKLSKNIDSVDQSIIGNVSSFKLQKRISPTINVVNSYSGPNTIKYANKITSGTIQSTAFYYNINSEIKAVYLKDSYVTTTTGEIDLIDFYSDKKLTSAVGTIDYTNGIISLPELKPAGFIENTKDIRIYAKMDELDISSTKDLILVIDDSTLDSSSGRTSGLTVTVSA